MDTDGRLLYLSLQEIHSDCFLVILGENPFTISLDHTALPHCTISHYHHLDGCLHLLLPHRAMIWNVFVRVLRGSWWPKNPSGYPLLSRKSALAEVTVWNRQPSRFVMVQVIQQYPCKESGCHLVTQIPHVSPRPTERHIESCYLQTTRDQILTLCRWPVYVSLWGLSVVGLSLSVCMWPGWACTRGDRSGRGHQTSPGQCGRQPAISCYCCLQMSQWPKHGWLKQKKG